MKRRVVSAVLVMAMVFGLTACGKEDAGSAADSANEPQQTSDAKTTENPADDKAVDAAGTENGESADSEGESLKIGFSTFTLGAEFFAALDEEMRVYVEEGGHEMITVACEGNVATQVSDIENLIAMDCDVITLFPVDPAAVEGVCAEAVEKGIKVYPIATVFENRNAYTCIQGGGQYGYGEQSARLASDWIDETFPDAEDGSIEVAVIGNTTTEEANERTEAMYAIEDMNPKVTLVGKGEFDTIGAANISTKSQEYADIIASKYPDVKVVVCYGIDIAIGANEAFMRDSNLDREHFGLFAVDTSQYAFEQIKLSTTNDSLIRGTVNFGDNLPLSVYELVTGQKDELADENGYISVPGVPISPANVDDYLE